MPEIVRVQRESMLQKLHSVRAGLDRSDVVEQSACFVFQRGKLMTYNDEAAAVMKSGLPKTFEGAVDGTPLLALLTSIPDDELDMEMSETQLTVRGKKRTANVRRHKTITLPIDAVDKPDEGAWQTLHENFANAVEMVLACVAKEDARFDLTCIHITPKWIESYNIYQMTRYRMKTGCASPSLVHPNSIKHIIPLGMTEFAESEAWLHFRNKSGLMVSCRRYTQQFPDLSGPLDFSGEPATLPKAIGEEGELAAIFAKDNTDSDSVMVVLKPGRLRVKGVGVYGDYDSGPMKLLNYNGEERIFMIDAKLLVEVIKRHTDCQIGENRLRIDGGKWTYITSLGKPPEQRKSKKDDNGKDNAASDD